MKTQKEIEDKLELLLKNIEDTDRYELGFARCLEWILEKDVGITEHIMLENSKYINKGV